MAEVKSPKKQVNLFYVIDCEDLAHKVALQSPNIILQNIKWSSLPQKEVLGRLRKLVDTYFIIDETSYKTNLQSMV
ncbi:hypothetical protein Fmac_032975 [Flemingia macrophylla]|uniref:Uncharacterized protein n=1 Tax=Flemingia macrophylla TaxID=520843 RepID=A0ABD1L6G5_9FABA